MKVEKGNNEKGRSDLSPFSLFELFIYFYTSGS